MQKNVEVKTEEIIVDSSSNLDKILSEFFVCGESEESVTTKTEEIKQENHIIIRTIITRIIKTKYSDKQGIPRKLKIVTTVTTTDDYPDGSSSSKVDISTTLTDIEMEDIESPELHDFKVIEAKSVDKDRHEKSIIVNGKSVLQIVTITTTKETLTSIDKTKKKLKTTVETITETIHGDGMTEVTKDVKVSVTDIGVNMLEENFEGFELIGQPKESTTTEIETIAENNIILKRKTTITTIVNTYINIHENIKRTKTTIKTVVEDEHPDSTVMIKTSEKISISDEILQEIADDLKLVDDNEEIHLKNLEPSGEPEINESIATEEIKAEAINIIRTIVTRTVKTNYCNKEGLLQKIKTVRTITTTDKYPDGTIKTTVDVSSFINDIISEDTLSEKNIQGVQKLPTTDFSCKRDSIVMIENNEKAETEYLKDKIMLPKEDMPESNKIEDALNDLISENEAEENLSYKDMDIIEKDITIKRNIVTKTLKTRYTDSEGRPKKLKTITTVTTTDNYPDGSARTSVESSTSISDIELSGNASENSLEGYSIIDQPKEDIISKEETVNIGGIAIQRRTTIITMTQVYANPKQNMKRTKVTVKTINEDEFPDGSIITKTSEQISFADEILETDEPNDNSIAKTMIIESALKDFSAIGNDEINETIETQEVEEQQMVVLRTITTRTVKTKYADNDGILRKLKTVTTITKVDQYPDGSSKTSTDTNTSINVIEMDDLIQSQDINIYPLLNDKSINVDTKEKIFMKDSKEVKEIITTITTKEILPSDDGSKKKEKTAVETITETIFPDGQTEVTKDVKVSIADYGIASFDDNLVGFTETGEPEKRITSDIQNVVENGIHIIRKTTITTTRQEFENSSLKLKKIKTTVKTVNEDEHPDGTVIIKKSEKVSIADLHLKISGLVNQETEPSEIYIDDSEIVEDVTEDSDIKHEVYQQDSLSIKRTITTKTKRETLASIDKNIKRIRTTVETTTVDEFPDGSTETTKDVKITISEFQRTSDSDLQAALQGLTLTGKNKTSVDKKTNIISDHGEKIIQTVTTYVTKEELLNNETNEIAVKTVTKTITENAKEDGSIETTKDVRTQITYLPIGTGLDDWSPEQLEEIEKQPVAQEEKILPLLEQLPLAPKDKVEQKPKKQRSPVGEITTDSETFTKVIKEGDNEVTQTITVITTKEVISPEKIKITVETTTVSKSNDGITKTTKSTKTTISEFKEEFEETIDRGESEKSFSKLSSRTGDMRSSSATSDDLDHQGVSSPPSDISSRDSRAATHVWGTESSGVYYSDDDGPGSPSSTKSQIAHSPRSNLSFELDAIKSQDQMEKQESMLHKDTSSGQLPEENLYTSPIYVERKSQVHTDKSTSKITEEFSSKGMSTLLKHTDTTFLREADEHFEKAIEEHKKVSGSKVISNVTAKYELDKQVHSSSSQSSHETITLKDLKTETKKVTENISSSKQETNYEKSEYTSETHTSKDPIESWGKPLGLPSPIMPPTQGDGKSTPKKQTSSAVLNKNKINQEKSKEAKNRTSESPNKKKAPGSVYMDLTYVPHHGNSYYSAMEFFKRVRARYYVFSGTEPSKEIYNALLDAKKTWEDKDLEVTIIPTYDTDVLGYWVTENEEALEKYKIDLSPSASRCTINLQDHETSCAAYRLEF